VTAVGDSSPLILFAGIGRFELLREIYGEILVPPAVWDEVVVHGAGRPGMAEVLSASWIHRRVTHDLELVRMLKADAGAGEAEAIALAARLDEPAALLLDDRRGRRIARRLGLTVVGSAGALGLAKDLGLISAIAPLLENLRSAGLYLSDDAARELLIEMGEQDSAHR
jgi:predicted nucleic acid-binding protein